MFTGIVKFVAPVHKVIKTNFGKSLVIKCDDLKEYALGGSIMINGACMTLVRVDNDLLYFDVINESLGKTNLGALLEDDLVNLEPSLKLESYLDGHLVSGHIDTKVRLVKVVGSDFYFELLPEVSRYISYKGSVCLNGVSLTVSGLTDTDFRVSLIPETISKTNFSRLNVQDFVNLEVDIVARYLERLIK